MASWKSGGEKKTDKERNSGGLIILSSLINDFIQSCRNYAACLNLPFPQYSKV